MITCEARVVGMLIWLGMARYGVVIALIRFTNQNSKQHNKRKERPKPKHTKAPVQTGMNTAFDRPKVTRSSLLFDKGAILTSNIF